jgi:hypothetical protein
VNRISRAPVKEDDAIRTRRIEFPTAEAPPQAGLRGRPRRVKTLACPVDDHSERGMVGSLTVR